MAEICGGRFGVSRTHSLNYCAVRADRAITACLQPHNRSAAANIWRLCTIRTRVFCVPAYLRAHACMRARVRGYPTVFICMPNFLQLGAYFVAGQALRLHKCELGVGHTGIRGIRDSHRSTTGEVRLRSELAAAGWPWLGWSGDGWAALRGGWHMEEGGWSPTGHTQCTNIHHFSTIN